MSRFPDFFVIGAMKAGTTSLYQYLRSHPQIFMSEQKELHYFSKPQVWGLGEAWYASQFEEGRDVLAVGEASASYSRFPEFPHVPERIFALVPEARFIYLLREPVDRMRSHYAHRRAGGRETRSVERALLEDPIYLDASRYALQIEHYLEYFERSCMLLVSQDDLRSRRAEVLIKVFEFLGVDAGWKLPAEADREHYRSADNRSFRDGAAWLKRLPGATRLARRAPASVRSVVLTRATRTGVPRIELSASLRTRLSRALAPDVARLRTLAGSDFDGWGIA